MRKEAEMIGNGDEIGLIGENFDLPRLQDVEYNNESRSGSDNSASGDHQDAARQRGGSKKKYNRHSPHQIQLLESVFREHPHPCERQRRELSQRLGLESKQIKFWFQNRRTQMKTNLERQENLMLRQDNNKLRADNDLLREAMRCPVCNYCGGPAVPGEATFEQQQLRDENAKLKDEIARMCALGEKLMGRPISSSFSQNLHSSGSNSSDSALAVGRNCGIGSNVPNGPDFGAGPMMRLMFGNQMMYEKSMFEDLVSVAMDELIKMADSDSPLWMKNSDNGNETLNHIEYRSVCTNNGVKPPGFVAEASRDTGLVLINSQTLVEILMDANRWAEMFPCIVARASTIEVISTGTGGTRNGALQLMQAEFQVVSPMVPIRQVKFLRHCKKHADDLWAVVDVSLDVNREVQNSQPRNGIQRLPSGCTIQDVANGYSKVVWLEHSEYNENDIHQLCRPLLRSGVGFGAQRWISTLQRQFENFAILLCPADLAYDHTGVSQDGSKSILKLAQRMTFNFYVGISASSVRKWDRLIFRNISEDTRILIRKNLNDPGEPSGVILSAATSLWFPVTHQRLFNFLCDRKTRHSWDILSDGGAMQEIVHIPKGQNGRNCVSLLRADAIDHSERSMLVVQETWIDTSAAAVVYAPVDVSSMDIVMKGGDSAYIALLPSGFAIYPDGVSWPLSSGGTTRPTDATRCLVRPETNRNGSRGSILTVGFQILVNSTPTAKLNLESVETVNSLITSTVKKIKAALH